MYLDPLYHTVGGPQEAAGEGERWAWEVPQTAVQDSAQDNQWEFEHTSDLGTVKGGHEKGLVIRGRGKGSPLNIIRMMK